MRRNLGRNLYAPGLGPAAVGVQLVGVQILGVDQGQFWSQMRGAVELDDVMEGLIKGLVFGTACSLIAVFEGYNAEPTAEGVGRGPLLIKVAPRGEGSKQARG